MKLIERLRRAPADQVRAEPPLTASADAGQSETSGTARPVGWLTDGIGFGTRSRVKGLPPVSAIAAQKHATVFACCNVIAGDLSKVPVKIYRRGPDGREERLRDHPASYLLNVEAAPGVPAAVARYALAYAYTLRGRSYAYAPRDGSGELQMIEPTRQDGCAVLRLGRQRFYDFEDGAGVQRRVPGRSMVHLRYMAEDGWTGRSPIEVAAESMGLALAGQEAAARTAAGGTTKGAIVLNDDYQDDESRARTATRIRESLQDPDTREWPVLSLSEDIKKLDLSAADQQLLESRKFDREQIAAIYRVPPSKLQMLEHGVKANGEQQAIDYLTDCLLHWATLVEQQLMMGVLTEGERRGGIFLRHDFGALLRPTTKDRYEALARAIGGPFMLANEGRRIEGLDDVPEGAVLNPAPNMTRDTAPKSEEETD
ncbi:phage portal protein [Pseudoroseicyclus aestuarii]|uniref:HK97 family phage portal protein n=1 Tax=Pseudoroseicyclus aestuarii TaxID=1795041 RepID=A0A318SLZ8_9RHOB|nr:phage portal protein [Pseudoroseicyclus aestuarii]PYE80823.1 HK97 family phage portal protein [Pseudoroseicyclus aestuarii]